MKTDWKGVLPAITTQFAEDLSIDVRATRAAADRLVDGGVAGLVVLGTLGENASLTSAEKLALLRAVVEASGNRVPVIAGVAEVTTELAISFIQEVECLGISGFLLAPALACIPTQTDLLEHFRAASSETDLPILLYNNPRAHAVEISLRTLAALQDVENVVGLKEASEDTRRITDIGNLCGNRFALFAGLDDVAFESIALGAQGWIAGIAGAFPEEAVRLFDLVQAGSLSDAHALYRWFMPLLHLNSSHDLVQSIKLVQETRGMGSQIVRPPRYPLSGYKRDAVIAMTDAALRRRPLTHLREAS